MTGEKLRIAVAKGDGIGPEIMDAVIYIFKSANVPLDYSFVEMGKYIFDKGFSTGMTPEARETIENLGILFKGPMETPKGKGVKSINVTARKVWNTYANVRRFRTLPGVETIFSKAGVPINLTILRENIEDTYGGIEYMHSQDVAVSYRLITRPGSEQFIRFCFEYAKREGINEVTCGHKANIMKMTDGLFLNLFHDISKDYSGIQVNDFIIDDLAMKLVRNPERFRLIMLTNLQGDVISDLCAGLIGGLGFAPSANVGDHISIFEAVHGTAPDIAGKKLANPTSLLLSGIMMLRHVGLMSYAAVIENALLYSIEHGYHTADFGDKGKPALNTNEFAEAIIENLGKAPAAAVTSAVPDFSYKHQQMPEKIRIMKTYSGERATLAGTDIFIESEEQANTIAETMKGITGGKFRLAMISNRGTQVWPTSSVYTDSVPHYCLRLEKTAEISQKDVFDLCSKISDLFRIVNVELLNEWGDVRGYSLAQGQ